MLMRNKNSAFLMVLLEIIAGCKLWTFCILWIFSYLRSCSIFFRATFKTPMVIK